MTDSRKIVATQIIRGDVHVQTAKNTRICCPYDGEICGTKRENRERICKDLAAHRIRVSLVYPETDTSLDKCPLVDTEMQRCKRYQCFLAAQQKVQSNGR